MAKQKIIRTGNSLAVTIPSQFVQGTGIKPGQEVRVKTEPETGRVIYTFSGTKQLPLANNFVKRKKRR
jgi:antitoxin component of MazEF toxin-antitoxin module